MILSISPERREELLALLEDGPKQTGELAGWLTISPNAAARYLRILQDEGLTQRLGRFSDSRWALVGYIENVVVERPPTPQPPKPVRAPKPALRQAAASATVAKDAPPPWWATADREGFTDRCHREAAEHMRGSIGARQAPYRVLA